jgi:hypothetical protein
MRTVPMGSSDGLLGFAQQMPEDLVGQKMEVRWWVPDGVGGRYLHCFEGTIKEIIPYSKTRPKYPELRSCKHPVALVEWDPEFDYKDSHVPLNPRRYAQDMENRGWNVLNSAYVAAQRSAAIAEAEQEENIRMEAAIGSAILDIGMANRECAC